MFFQSPTNQPFYASHRRDSSVHEFPPFSKGPRTRGDKMKLSVHLGEIFVKKSVGLSCTDKLHSVWLLTIRYLKIRFISEKVNVIISRLAPFVATF